MSQLEPEKYAKKLQKEKAEKEQEEKEQKEAQAASEMAGTKEDAFEVPEDAFLKNANQE